LFDWASLFASTGVQVDTFTQSIATILQPHTSSPALLTVARAMASLVTANISGDSLDQVLSAHLDSLAISPQTKQGIIPALLGMAKLAELRALG
jgi:hypothetical protein